MERIECNGTIEQMYNKLQQATRLNVKLEQGKITVTRSYFWSKIVAVITMQKKFAEMVITSEDNASSILMCLGIVFLLVLSNDGNVCAAGLPMLILLFGFLYSRSHASENITFLNGSIRNALDGPAAGFAAEPVWKSSMFGARLVCWNCDEKVGKENKKCPYCGAKFGKADIRAGPEAKGGRAGQSAAATADPLKMTKPEPEAIGGWLAFFIYVGCFIASPLLNLALLFGGGVPNFIVLLQGLGTISLFPMMGYFLLKKKTFAVAFTKIIMVTLLITNLLSLLGGVLSSINPLMLFVYPIIWLWYFSTSKKVQSIYGNLKEKTEGQPVWPELAFLYSILSPSFGIALSIFSIYRILSNRNTAGLLISVLALIIALALFLAPVYGVLTHPVDDRVMTSCRAYCEEKVSYFGGSYTVYYDFWAFSYHCQCYSYDRKVGDMYLNPGSS